MTEQSSIALAGTCHEQCWVCSGRADLRKLKNCCITAPGRGEWEMEEKQPCNHWHQGRRRADCAPGAEQKLSVEAYDITDCPPAAYGHHMGQVTTWGKSPHAAIEESTGRRGWSLNEPQPVATHLGEAPGQSGSLWRAAHGGTVQL